MLFGALVLSLSTSAVSRADPAQLNTGVDEGYDGSVWRVAPDGSLTGVWQWRPKGARRDAREIRTSTRAPAGAWQAPATVAVSTTDDLLLWDAEVDNAGNTYVLYQAGGRSGEPAKRLALRVRPHGGSWSADELVASKQAGTGGGPSRGKMVVGPDGTVVVVWCEQTAGPPAANQHYDGQTLIRTADRSAEGAWSEPLTLWTQEPNSQCDLGPDISIEQNRRGDVVALWHDDGPWDSTRGQNDQLNELIAAVRPAEVGWSAPSVVDVTRGFSRSRVAVGPSGRGHVAIFARERAPKYAAVSTAGVEVAATTVPGSTAGTYMTTGAVAVDALDTAVLVWNTSYGKASWNVSRPTVLTAARQPDGRWSRVEPLDPLEPAAPTFLLDRQLVSDWAGNITFSWAEQTYRTVGGRLEESTVSALRVTRPSGAMWTTRGMLAAAPSWSGTPFLVPSTGSPGAGQLLWPVRTGLQAHDVQAAPTGPSRAPSLKVPTKRVSEALRARALVVKCRVEPHGYCSVRLQPDGKTAKTFKDPRASCIDLVLRSRANAQGEATVKFRVSTPVSYCRRWLSRSSWRFTAFATADAAGRASAQRRQTITIRK